MHLISLVGLALACVTHPGVKAIPTPESAVLSVSTSPFYVAAQYCADSAVAAVFAIASALHVVPNAGASAGCIPVKSSSAAESAIDPDAIPNGFFVKLKDKTQKAAHLDAVNQFIANNAHCSDIKSEVTSANDGSSIYSGIFAPDVVAFIEQQPLVAGVFPNQRVKVPTEYNLTEPAFLNKNAPWTLARLAQKDVLRPGTRGMGSSDTSQDWTYPLIDLSKQTAKNPVFIYVLDLGVRASHQEFKYDRVVTGVDWHGGHDTYDEDGHGTAVAGSAAGATLGSAPLAKIVPVKLAKQRQELDTKAISEGVENAMDDYVKVKKRLYPGAAGIIQLSIETAGLEKSFTKAINNGMHVVTAAGNKNKDECSDLAKDVGQINVGAIDITDHRARFESRDEPGSNFGPCVEIYAGGGSVRTAGYKSDTAIVTEYGTSFAAPQVAGIIANKIFYGGNKSPAAMKKEILAEAVQNKIVGLEAGSINKIAQLPAALIRR